MLIKNRSKVGNETNFNISINNYYSNIIPADYCYTWLIIIINVNNVMLFFILYKILWVLWCTMHLWFYSYLCRNHLLFRINTFFLITKYIIRLYNNNNNNIYTSTLYSLIVIYYYNLRIIIYNMKLWTTTSVSIMIQIST